MPTFLNTKLNVRRRPSVARHFSSTFNLQRSALNYSDVLAFLWSISSITNFLFFFFFAHTLLSGAFIHPSRNIPSTRCLQTIHRPVLRLTAIICILTVMLWAARSQLSGRVYPSLLSSSHFGPPYLSYSPLSRIENHAAGRWARRESPILTQNDMSSLMPGMKYTHQTCEGGLARLYKIASWEWLGQDGSRLEFDAKRFLVDLLRRQAGLFFIGGEFFLYRHVSRSLVEHYLPSATISDQPGVGTICDRA